MKKFISILLCTILCIFSFSNTIYAYDNSSSELKTIIIDNETYYIQVIISDVTYSNTKDQNTVSASKTVNMLNASNQVMWSVSVTGYFIYDGISATCVACTPSAAAYESHWSIKSCSGSYIQNTATTTATATQTGLFGMTHDFTESVSVYCSPTGVTY